MQNNISQPYALRPSAAVAGPAGEEPPASGFVGRRAVTSTILDQLAAGGGAGCIVVGEAGSGKTALIHHVLRKCSADTYVVHVRGSAFSGRTPFGALTFLLSDLEPDVASHPVLILRGLTRLIQERAQGRAVLLAVDNGEELDEFSAMALSQMVLSRTAGLLASFRDFSRAPAEFTGLWREGILSRVDLEPLNLAETAELVSAELDGPVSASAVAKLHRHTGGNPHLLMLGCEDFRASGGLRRSGNGSGNVWVLEPHRSAPAGRVAEAVLARLEALTDRQLALVRTVALAGVLPLSVALHEVEPGEVDSLQEQEILAVEHQGVPCVRIRDAVLARAVCRSLAASTRKDLLQQLRQAAAVPAPAAGTMDPAAAILDPCRLAQWQLDSAEVLDQDLALTAARAANAAGRPSAAVRFITSSKDWAQSPEAVLEQVEARMVQGEYGMALATLSGYRSSNVVAAPLEEVRLLIAENRVLCMAATGALSAELPAGALPAGAAKKHEELLAKAEQRLAVYSAAGTISPADAAALDRTLVLARAECNSSHGRFLENAVYLAPFHAESTGRDKEFQVLIGSWLCEAWGLTERQDDAVKLAQDLERLLSEPGISRSGRARAFARIIHVYLAAGAVNTARRLLDQQAANGDTTLFPGLFGELGEGVLYAYAGEPAAALRRLVPAVAQLRRSGPEAMLPLAASATAYCLALQKNPGGAQTYLTLRSKAADGGPWTMRRAARHFGALAEGAMGSPQAARRFLELAAHDHRRGAYSYELLSLFSAARLGEMRQLDRILTVAAQQQGPFARMCEIYAKGAGGYDPQLLIQAGQLGEAAGHVLFGRETSERALEVAAGSGDRATVRFIHRSRRGTEAAVAVGTAAGDDVLRSLTSRERSIARMAASGSSNKVIAAELNISVRTVEGHLYQVYSKLHVGSRREMAKVIAEKSGEQK